MNKMKDLLIKNLNPPQMEAVFYTEGPLIIFAGAGTGKTRVITHRIAYLLSLGITPWSVLAVTFTNKAAAEMKQRVINLIPQTGTKVWISTFHSFCAYFLRVEASKINLNPYFLIYDFNDQKNVIKDCLKELNIDEKKIKISTLIDRISRAKDNLKYPSDITSELNNISDSIGYIIAEVYRLYQKKLEMANALDFGDLIMQTVSAIYKYPTLLEYYQKKYKYIMVDEYQDTNHAQYVFIKLIAGKHSNICVVGDDDQSIYSWRGADINNILNFKKDYPSAKYVKLEQNYRSTPKILAIAHKLVKHNTERIDKYLWTKNPDNGFVSVLQTINENSEAVKVAELISLKVLTDKYNFSDFAVFYRTNAQSRTFEDAFRRIGIPYNIIGTLRFYDRAEIKNIMAYLKLILNPNDNISLKRIINIPRRSIGKISLEIIEKFAILKNISIWQAISAVQEVGLKSKAVTALTSFAQLIRTFIDLKNSTSIKEIAEKVITYSGYLRELENEDTPESRTKIENIKELISAIDDFEKRSLDKTLMGYLTQTALISDMDFFDESRGKVTLMTLHLAKGLEFNNVFICGLEEGLFPMRESFFDAKDLAEERRLMYVGITRARKHLYLCWATERTVYGKTKWNIPSRFIAEAGFKNESTERDQNFGRFKQNFNNSSKIIQKSKNQYNEIMKNKSLHVSIETSNQYKIGSIVLHPTFGKGEIIEKNGTGSNLKIVVLFETGQWKKLLVKISNLTLL